MHIRIENTRCERAHLEQEGHEADVVDGLGELNVAKVPGAVQLAAPARRAIEAALGGAETQVEQTALFRHAALRVEGDSARHNPRHAGRGV